MALNVALGPDRLPAPFAGEVFVLSRSGTGLEVEHGPRRRPPMRGVLYVTNLRIVLVVDQARVARAEADSLELPFQGINDESFNQPIFGVNNLSGRCRPYDDQPFEGELRFKIKFYEGGAGTFLPIFNAVLAATRRGQAAAGNTATHWTEQVVSGQLSNSAFIDPNDPTTLYTAQPAPQQHQSPLPAWTNLRARPGRF